MSIPEKKDAKWALSKSMKEQDYDPKYAGGVLLMLKMNGFEIVKTDELERLLRTNRCIAFQLNEQIQNLEAGINRQ